MASASSTRHYYSFHIAAEEQCRPAASKIYPNIYGDEKVFISIYIYIRSWKLIMVTEQQTFTYIYAFYRVLAM